VVGRRGRALGMGLVTAFLGAAVTVQRDVS
jgi:hypothetical protein